MQYQQPRQFFVHRAEDPTRTQAIAERTFEAAAVAYLEHEHVEGEAVDLVVIAEDGARQAFTVPLH